jgi:hypothetical protein
MTDKFVTPEPLPEGLDRELLTILIEECAEVQKRATKALRFGLEEIQPGQNFDNIQRLSMEIGDVQETLRRCIEEQIVCPEGIDAGMERKSKQLDKFLQFTSADEQD